MTTSLAQYSASSVNDRTESMAFPEKALAFTSGAFISGIQSLANTGIDVINLTQSKDNEIERFSTYDTMSKVDVAWGDYYTQNKDAIDLTGFVIGSIAPGMLAVKGLNALKAGSAFGGYGRALGYFADNQVKYLKAANMDLVTQGGGLFSRFNANLVKSIAFGAGDAILETAVAEAVTAVAMKASPLLDNKSWGDIISDGAVTSLVFGGGFGGLVSAVKNTGTFTKTAQAIDKASNKYGTIALGEKINLSPGDAIVKTFQDLAELPASVYESDKILPLSFKVGGKVVDQALDVSSALERTLARTTDKTLLNVRQTLTDGLGGGDASIGNALAEHATMLIKSARNAGEHDIAQTAQFAFANRFGGMVKAESLAASGNTVKKFRPGVALPDDAPALFLNLRTGATSLSATPTIADIATGELSQANVQFGRYLDAGGKRFDFAPNTFAPEVKLTAESSIEDTARHVWASQIKSLDGAVINEHDWSVLDKIRETPELLSGNKKPLTIVTKDFGEIPLEDFVGSSISTHILGKKVNYLHDYLLANPKTDLSLLARKMNVTEDWIQNTIATKFAEKIEEGSSRELTSWMKREHVKVTYDRNVPQSWDQPGEGLLINLEKTAIAQEARERGSAHLLGEAYEQLPTLSADSVKKNASRTGSGAGVLTASNADYADELGRTMQQVGVVARNTIQERTKLALDGISPAAHAVLSKPQAAAELASTMELLRKTSSKDGWALMNVPGASDTGYVLVRKASHGGDSELLAEVLASANNKDVVPLINRETASFWERFQGWRAEAQTRHSVGHNSVGKVIDWPLDELYAPPIDTRKHNFFAFLVPHEGKILGDTDVGMLTAKSAQDLESLAKQVGTDFKVVFKSDSEAFFKAKGAYEFDRALNKPGINSARARAGKLSNAAPNMRPEETITEFLAYMERKETQIVRDGVELKYAEEFAQLRTMSEEAVASSSSKMQWLPKAFQRTQVKDPFGDYIKTALDISKQHEYPMLSMMNEFVDSLGTRAGGIVNEVVGKAKGGSVSWEEAEATMHRVGIGGAINRDLWMSAQTGTDKNLARTFVSMSNSILATTQLAWDTANSLINIISSPIRMAGEIQAIKKLDPETFMKLAGVAGPDGASSISATKLMANAARNYWDPSAAAKIARFEKAGFIPTDLKFHRQLVDDIASTANIVPSKLKERFEKIAETGATLTGNKFAEKFTRFVAADVVDQLTSPLVSSGKMSQAEADSFINIFVNRVQGNYHASQRPIAFQGTIGSAISLFQTYQFGMLQQVGKYIQDGNTRALMVTAGMQTSIFGLNGLPFFDAINSHILGKYSTNPEHKDLYSAVGGDPMGDWLLYGSASAFPLFGRSNMPALYGRGDLNPRNLTLLPTSPSQVPFVQAYGKMLGTLDKVASLYGAGAPGKEAVLFGLEHNGMSRPLAGLAQAFQGYSTTGKGNISSYNDLISIGSAYRLLGAKPMDEALFVQHNYRKDQYQAYDAQRLEVMGEAIKMKVRNGQPVEQDEYDGLLSEYASRGGRVENFTKALNRWTKDAEESAVTKLLEKNQNPRTQRMIEIMGGSFPQATVPVESQLAE